MPPANDPTWRKVVRSRTAGEDMLPTLLYIVLGSAIMFSSVAQARVALPAPRWSDVWSVCYRGLLKRKRQKVKSGTLFYRAAMVLSGRPSPRR